jgi:imidazole glycerol-phosphate synthase subunit HisH
MHDVSIVDYGICNIRSVRSALEECGGRVKIIKTPEDLINSKKIILPGVGAFSDGINRLHDLDLFDSLKNFAATGGSILGICLGMQMLSTYSEEFGYHKGLDLIPGDVTLIGSKDSNSGNLKLPNIGWRPIVSSNLDGWNSSVLRNTTEGTAVYFVHSYCVNTDNKKHTIAKSYYGGHPITVAIKKDNITGLQFHPEKSSKSGLVILKSFLLECTN